MYKEWFTYSDGILLIWLLLAHIATDFILQTEKMVEGKCKQLWFSKFLYAHGIIAALTVWLASGLNLPIWIALSVGITHIIIDVIKIKLDKKNTINAFAIDQLAHILIIILAWLFLINKWGIICKVTKQLALDYKLMLIVTGYIVLIWPIGFLIRIFIGTILTNDKTKLKDEKITDDAEHAGRYIGIFERIIILTLVLLNQYDAIGFLITGKSIIRMNSKSQTEYVLMGTMLSYALAIITGVLINWLLVFKG